MLLPVLRHRGWTCRQTAMLTFQDGSRRAINRDVQIKTVSLDKGGDRQIVELECGSSSEGFAYHLAQGPRLGGEAIVGYLDGEPAGCTGWFIIDGIARYRHIATRPAFRGRGVATTLIRHVQQHPAVRAAHALCIHVAEGGPQQLYEACGFVPHSVAWDCLLETIVPDVRRTP